MINTNNYSITEPYMAAFSELEDKASQLLGDVFSTMNNPISQTSQDSFSEKFLNKTTAEQLYNRLYEFILVSNNLYKDLFLHGYKTKNRSKTLPYKKYIVMIEKVIFILENHYNMPVGKIPLSCFELIQHKTNFNFLIKQLKTKFSNLNISPNLNRIIISSLTAVIKNKSVNRGQIKHVFRIINDLLSAEITSQYEMEIFLINRDFQSNEFYNYCIESINNILEQESNLHNQYESILVMEDKITTYSSPKEKTSIPKDEPSINEKIKCYMKAKKVNIRQRIKIKRAEVVDSKLMEESDKIMIGLPVAQLALLIRLLLEMNLLPKDNIGKTFSFFSKKFQTPNTIFISAESLQKKSSTVEFATATKVKGILISMINWINTNYNTSSYS